MMTTSARELALTLASKEHFISVCCLYICYDSDVVFMRDRIRDHSLFMPQLGTEQK